MGEHISIAVSHKSVAAHQVQTYDTLVSKKIELGETLQGEMIVKTYRQNSMAIKLCVYVIQRLV